MKYSDLISFNPIEDVIQLTTADDANRAKEYVKSYVMSDTMAVNLKSPVLDQLQMDEVVDNKQMEMRKTLQKRWSASQASLKYFVLRSAA